MAPQLSPLQRGPGPELRGGPADQPGLCLNVTVFKQFTNETHCQKPLDLIETVDELFRVSEYQIIYTDTHQGTAVSQKASNPQTPVLEKLVFYRVTFQITDKTVNLQE